MERDTSWADAIASSPHRLTLECVKRLDQILATRQGPSRSAASQSPSSLIPPSTSSPSTASDGKDPLSAAPVTRQGPVNYHVSTTTTAACLLRPSRPLAPPKPLVRLRHPLSLALLHRHELLQMRLFRQLDHHPALPTSDTLEPLSELHEAVLSRPEIGGVRGSAESRGGPGYGHRRGWRC